MKRSPASYRRIGQKAWPRFVWSIVAACVIVSIYIGIKSIASAPLLREFVVIWTDPVQIVSMDPSWQSVVTMEVPSDVLVPAAFGYGQYPVSSLLELDSLEERNGKLVTESLTQAFGLPVGTYIVISDKISFAEPKAGLQQVFSWTSIPKYLQGKIDSPVTLRTWLRWVMAAKSLRASSVRSVPIDTVFVSKKQADGTTVRTLDQSRLDFHLESAFADTGIRKEALSVGFYNTTDVSGLGQKAARALSHIGAPVVFIGNEEGSLDRCKARTRRSLAQSKTFLFIRTFYGCGEEFIEEGESQVADILVYLGKDYAALFTKQ